MGQAPGRVGEYMGTTGYRMDAGDAIYAGFADYYLPEADWPALIAELEKTGDYNRIDAAAKPAPAAKLATMQDQIDAYFAGETLHDIITLLRQTDDEFTAATLKVLARQSPLSAACTIEAIHRIRGKQAIEPALELEYRFTFRSVDQGDFVEGIRAQIIDKDRNPKWKHDSIDTVTAVDVSRMLMPLGADKLKL